MKVLITGTEGYIGSRLAPLLMARGHEIVGLDTGFYRDGWLYSDPVSSPVGAAHESSRICAASSSAISRDSMR